MNLEDIKKPENIVYRKTPLLTDAIMHYCPGCSHGTVHKIIAEVIDEMGIQDKTIAISPVGCSVFAYNYIDVDWQEAAHGRAPALATATKRLNPDKYVFTYQGDGDLAALFRDRHNKYHRYAALLLPHPGLRLLLCRPCQGGEKILSALLFRLRDGAAHKGADRRRAARRGDILLYSRDKTVETFL